MGSGSIEKLVTPKDVNKLLQLWDRKPQFGAAVILWICSKFTWRNLLNCRS